MPEQQMKLLGQEYDNIKRMFIQYNEICDGILFTDFETEIISREAATPALKDITCYYALDSKAEFCSILLDKIEMKGIPVRQMLHNYFDKKYPVHK